MYVMYTLRVRICKGMILKMIIGERIEVQLEGAAGLLVQTPPLADLELHSEGRFLGLLRPCGWVVPYRVVGLESLGQLCPVCELSVLWIDSSRFIVFLLLVLEGLDFCFPFLWDSF